MYILSSIYIGAVVFVCKFKKCGDDDYDVLAIVCGIKGIKTLI